MNNAYADNAPDPDFIIVGCPLPDGQVMVLASKELTRAQLDHQMEYRDYYPGLFGPTTLTPERSVLVSSRTTISADIGDYVRIIAPDYVTALRHLFESAWQPKPDKRPKGIDEGMRGIES